jgi:hypothetical protein
MAVASILLQPGDVFAFRSGPPPARDGSVVAGGVSCRDCHGNAVGPGLVEILGFPAQYQADATYNISVRIADPIRFGAGFQASVQTAAGQPAGTLIRTDLANTQLSFQSSPPWRGINHTSTGVNNAVANWLAMGDSATYNFQWRAPASDVGAVTAWAAGNAINNDFSLSGDNIYLSNVTSPFGGFATGACCDDSTGICTEAEPQDVCVTSGLRFGGVGSTCATIDPPCVEPAGACCDESTGVCANDQLQADCQTAGGRYGGPNSTCATIDPACTEPAGACCDGNTGVCDDDVLEADCAGDQLAWSALAACSSLDPPCTEHTGACCNLLSGVCTDGVAGSQCAEPQQRWTKGAACSAVACDAATGACCDSDTFGACTDGTTPAECACASCQWFENRDCGTLECAHAAIPTVGTWGLGVLTLLLLIAAKVAFRPGRRIVLTNTEGGVPYLVQGDGSSRTWSNNRSSAR